MYYYIANMESESFSWYALGGTEEEAKEAILDKWNERAYSTQMNLGIDAYPSVEELEEDYGIDIIKLVRGQCVVY